MVISKSRGVKSKFDISIELSTKTIKRLYYYIVNRFFNYYNSSVLSKQVIASPLINTFSPISIQFISPPLFES